MPTFKQYLFLGNREGEWTGEGTKAWLDVMIWSSAQPHSVSDMVGKCFGVDNGAQVEDASNINGWYSENDNENESDDFVAIWARDTLGLSNTASPPSPPFYSLLISIPPQTKHTNNKRPRKTLTVLVERKLLTHTNALYGRMLGEGRAPSLFLRVKMEAIAITHSNKSREAVFAALQPIFSQSIFDDTSVNS